MERELEKKREKEEDFFDDEDVYSEKARDVLVDDDEMTLEEEGFMEGYEEAD